MIGVHSTHMHPAPASDDIQKPQKTRSSPIGLLELCLGLGNTVSTESIKDVHLELIALRIQPTIAPG